jgi:hypothetical protein
MQIQLSLKKNWKVLEVDMVLQMTLQQSMTSVHDATDVHQRETND